MSEQALKVSKRSTEIHYAVRDVVLMARQAQADGKEVVYLNIGDPTQFDFPTPEPVVEAVCKATRDQQTSYAPSEGIASAREAVRRDAETRCGIKSVQDVFVGTGSSECIEIALAALLDPGDELLVPSPGYPFYSASAAKLGIREVSYPLDESRHWEPNIEAMERCITERTRAIVIINPNNPTGSVVDRAAVERVLDVARRHRLVVFSDEIYDRLVLDDLAYCSTASLADDVPVVTFNGLAKAFLCPGLRVGWCVVSGPEKQLLPYVEAMRKFLRARLCAPHPVQFAVPAAFANLDHLTIVREKLRRRRDITVDILNRSQHLSCVAPRAAFYAFVKIHGKNVADTPWVAKLVRQTGVVVVPGSGFGEPCGPGHFRVVFLPSEPILKSALERIVSFSEELSVC